MSQDIGPSDPRMQLVSWRGKPYYTSYANHQWYLQNSQSAEGKAKFRRHADFIRKIKKIESFPLFVERGDIVIVLPDILSANADFALANEIKQLRDIFRVLSHPIIYLIGASFQLELAHHLDDTVSKETAYRHSTSTAQAQALTSGVSAWDLIEAHNQALLGLRRDFTELKQQVTTYSGERNALYTELAGKAEALIQEQNQALKEEVASLKRQIGQFTPPEGYKTILQWARDTFGPERQALWVLLRSPTHVNRWREIEYLEYLASEEMRKQGLVPELYPLNNGRYLHVPYAIFRTALDFYIAQQGARGMRPHIIQGNQKPKAV